MALTRKRPEFIEANLTITGQGKEETMKVTYHNRTQKEVEAKVAEGNPTGTLLFMVKEWDSDYPLTPEGVDEMESDHPFITIGIFQGFHAARRTHVVKN